MIARDHDGLARIGGELCYKGCPVTNLYPSMQGELERFLAALLDAGITDEDTLDRALDRAKAQGREEADEEWRESLEQNHT